MSFPLLTVLTLGLALAAATPTRAYTVATSGIELVATAVGEDLWELTLEFDQPFIYGGMFGIEQVVAVWDAQRRQYGAEFVPNATVCDPARESGLICVPVSGLNFDDVPVIADITYMIVAVIDPMIAPNVGDPLLLGTVRTQGIVDGQILTSVGLDFMTGVPDQPPFDPFDWSETTFVTVNGDVVQSEVPQPSVTPLPPRDDPPPPPPPPPPGDDPLPPPDDGPPPIGGDDSGGTDVNPVPEPHAIALFLVGGGVAAFVLRRAARR
jgi:hypothetical protein